MASTKAERAPRVRVENSTALRAATALLAHLRKTRTSSDLLDAASPVFLTLTLKRTPGRAKGKPVRVRLPHSLLAPEEGVECCIIAKDPAKPFKLKLAETPVPGFTRVIGVGKLRKNYKQFKDRRELVQQYDAFFADDRVVRMMPQVCGKTFSERRKMPVPVKISGNNWQKELIAARDSTYFPVGSKNVSIKVGKDNMAAEAVAENIMAVLEPAVDHMPRKWRGIQRVDLHGVNTVLLPLYKALPHREIEDGDDSMDEDGEDDDVSEFSEADADALEAAGMWPLGDAASDADESDEEADAARKPASKPSAKRARVGEDGKKAAPTAPVVSDKETGRDRKRKGEIAAAVLGKEGASDRRSAPSTTDAATKPANKSAKPDARASTPAGSHAAAAKSAEAKPAKAGDAATKPAVQTVGGGKSTATPAATTTTTKSGKADVATAAKPAPKAAVDATPAIPKASTAKPARKSVTEAEPSKRREPAVASKPAAKKAGK